MAETINYELVRDRLIETRRRQRLSLREVAERTELSAATLSRFEKEKSTPDLPTLSKLADWLELDRADVFNAPDQEAQDTPAKVKAHLRADKNLDRETAEALARSFDELYKNFARDASK
jgi:transcriptional regulator with XRE-family HTH domain